jgi:hypothetical protein
MGGHTIRAAYSDHTIRVYQAYRPEIAVPVLEAGRFVPPFQMGRTTWIKPSFNWMMYRSGYATKPGQEVILGIDITRKGFEWALENAVLSTFTPSVHSSRDEWQRLLSEKPVRIQWDPERDCYLKIVNGVRAIQIGLSGEAVKHYVNDWVVRIEDMTDVAHRISAEVKRGVKPSNLPGQIETAYPVNPELWHDLRVD